MLKEKFKTTISKIFKKREFLTKEQKKNFNELYIAEIYKDVKTFEEDERTNELNNRIRDKIGSLNDN